MKKIISLLLLFVFVFVQCVPVYAMDMASEFLCEIGTKLYKDGRIYEALHEFKKALLVNPSNEEARRTIALILYQYKMEPQEVVPEVFGPSKKKRLTRIVPRELLRESSLSESAGFIAPVPAETGRVLSEEEVAREIASLEGLETTAPAMVSPKNKDAVLRSMKESLKKIEAERKAPSRRAVLPPATKISPGGKGGQAAKPQELTLDELQALKSPIELEIGQGVDVKGMSISRFLVTQPDIMTVQKTGPDHVLLTAQKVGSTYVYIWDANKRWILDMRSIPPKAQGPTLDEEIRSEEDRAKDFYLKYALDWTAFETGRGVSTLKRQSYSWTHSLNLNGEIPYGNLDSALSVSADRLSTDLTYFTVGVTRGKFLDFNDFSIRAVDFSPGFSNLAFNGGNLRGASFYSPALHNRLNYRVFWGREGGGKYAGLSPGLVKIRDSFLSGIDINLQPTLNQTYEATYFRGWGNERNAGLMPYGYDLKANYALDKARLGYEVAYDSQSYAYRLNSNFNGPRLTMFSELRDTDKNFQSSSGLGSEAGELGFLTNGLYKLRDNVDLTGRLNIFRDRLLPNPDRPQYWNQDIGTGANVRIDDLTNARFDYGYQDFTGRVSPSRAYSLGAGLFHTFNWIRKVNTHASTFYNINRNYSSAGLDYASYKVLTGFRFNLVDSMDYFFDQEFDWVFPLKTTGDASPRSFDTGVNWSHQFGANSPFSGTLRVTYHKEENVMSPFSFMSGQDYMEWYGEIDYRPTPDFEAFFDTTVRNIWAVNPDVQKRIEANFYAGLRYLWDTGFRWEAVGVIEGHVFNDLNADGLREKAEPPVPGAKVTIGKKIQTTNKDGFFRFSKVKAKEVQVTLDSSSIPSGFVLTVPSSQTVEIKQGKKEVVNFGIATRTEISGTVFVDVDGTGQLAPNSSGISGIVLRAEDGTKATTDGYGRYTLRKLPAGKHKVTLDLNTLPSIYIPTVPIFKEVELQEGMSFTFNIPVKLVTKKK